METLTTAAGLKSVSKPGFTLASLASPEVLRNLVLPASEAM